MYYLILVLHLLIALLLGVVVLLQRSKGNGLAGAFGGVGAGEAMFGSHGVTTMLHKATIYLAIAFMVTSLGLAFLTARRGGGTGGPARPTGRVVLPVGGSDVAAPEVPTATPTDEVVPGETGDDDIVPAGPESTEEGAAEDDTTPPAPEEEEGGEGEAQGTEGGAGGGGR